MSGIINIDSELYINFLEEKVRSLQDTINELTKDNQELENRVSELIGMNDQFHTDHQKAALFDQTNTAAGKLMEKNRKLEEENRKLLNMLNNGTNGIVTVHDGIQEEDVVQWNKKNFGEHFPIAAIKMISDLQFMLNVYRKGNDQDNTDPETIKGQNIVEMINQLGKTVGYRLLLGMMEELGEIAHVHLKREQGIRIGRDKEQCEYRIKDGVGDLLIYLINYCDSQGFTMKEAFDLAWMEVRDRDWKENPINGSRTAPDPIVERIVAQLDKPVVDLADEYEESGNVFSIRAYNVIRSAFPKNIKGRELLNIRRMDWKKYRNVGRVTLNEIDGFYRWLGISYKKTIKESEK